MVVFKYKVHALAGPSEPTRQRGRQKGIEQMKLVAGFIRDFASAQAVIAALKQNDQVPEYLIISHAAWRCIRYDELQLSIVIVGENKTGWMLGDPAVWVSGVKLFHDEDKPMRK